MKLLKQTGHGFQYRLSQEESHSLRLLVHQFPLTAFSPVKISKTDSKSHEREKFINESLTAHQEELRHKARGLVGEDKFATSGENRLFRISLEGREIMLQILNDIRVECWRSLGEPEELDMNILELPQEKIKQYHFMHLAGFFEYHFLNLEEENNE
jgi:hypothetical protein